jgi:adenosylmethionine-8-amino-7-oxononanoate aminotransferase
MDDELRPTLSGPALWSAQAHLPSVLGRQVVIERGEGSYLHTTDGRRLFDGTAGLWHANVGHGRPELAEAAVAQMQRLETYHIFGRFLNDRALELGERLAAISPIPDAKIILNSGGSDAIDVACKLSRRHWQLQGRRKKTMILSREFAYHGLLAYGTSSAGYGTDSLVPETARVSTYDIAAVESAVDRIGPDNIAALVAEPVQGTGGVIPPAPGYLEGLQRMCRENEILLVVDEVITGFGRTGEMFATERFALEPDMITFAKGVTSGYLPLGGVMVTPEVWKPFYADDKDAPVFRHGATYAGHATACAVALRHLDLLEEEKLLPRVQELEHTLVDQMRRLDQLDGVVETRVGGLMAGIALREDLSAESVTDDLIEAGFVARPLRGNTVQLSPPFITTDSELVDLVDAVGAVVSAHDRGGR